MTTEADTADVLADKLEGVAIAGQELSLVVGPLEALELSRMLRGEMSFEAEARLLSTRMMVADWIVRRERADAWSRRLIWIVAGLAAAEQIIQIARGFF